MICNGIERLKERSHLAECKIERTDDIRNVSEDRRHRGFKHGEQSGAGESADYENCTG